MAIEDEGMMQPDTYTENSGMSHRVLEFIQRMHCHRNLADVLHETARSAQELVGADAVFIFLANAGSDDLIFQNAILNDDADEIVQRYQEATSGPSIAPSGEVASSAHSSGGHAVVAGGESDTRLGRHGSLSFLEVPMWHEEMMIGLMEVLKRWHEDFVSPDARNGESESTAFTAEDERGLALLSRHAVLALVTAQEFEQLAWEKAQLEKTVARRDRELVTRISHEINNPLTAILGNALLLRREFAAIDGKASKQLQVIADSARRISTVTRKLCTDMSPEA